MDIDAFILIGGRSCRFGSDKAFAEIGGQMLAGRAAETVEIGLSPEHLRFVTASDNQFAGDLIFGLGRPVVADLKPGHGAWSGLHTALAYSQSDWVFVLACDLPFVTPVLLEKLAGSVADDIDAVVPRQSDGRLQPLCSFYRRVPVLNEVEHRMATSKLLPPITEVFSGLNVRMVEFEEYGDLAGSEEFFVNVNSIRDLPVGHRV